MPVNIADVTHVEDDQCVSHYEPVPPLNKNGCSIDFVNDQVNDTQRKRVDDHNTGKICLATCIYDYKVRIEIFYKMLKFIHSYLGKLGIEWCLYYGGLAGFYTRRELLPWDPDIDILVNVSNNKYLSANGYKDARYTFGINAPDAPGAASDIIGRCIDRESGLYCDVTYYKVDPSGAILVKKMPSKGDRRPYMVIPRDRFYPLTDESFSNGTVVRVPSDILYNLSQRYGHFRDHYVLNTASGRYVLRSTS